MNKENLHNIVSILLLAILTGATMVDVFMNSTIYIIVEDENEILKITDVITYGELSMLIDGVETSFLPSDDIIYFGNVGTINQSVYMGMQDSWLWSRQPFENVTSSSDINLVEWNISFNPTIRYSIDDNERPINPDYRLEFHYYFCNYTTEERIVISSSTSPSIDSNGYVFSGLAPIDGYWEIGMVMFMIKN